MLELFIVNTVSGISNDSDIRTFGCSSDIRVFHSLKQHTHRPTICTVKIRKSCFFMLSLNWYAGILRRRWKVFSSEISIRFKHRVSNVMWWVEIKGINCLETSQTNVQYVIRPVPFIERYIAPSLHANWHYQSTPF